MSIGGSKLRACGKAGAKRHEKERNNEDERFEGGARENRDVKLCAGGKVTPINGGWEIVHCGI